MPTEPTVRYKFPKEREKLLKLAKRDQRIRSGSDFSSSNIQKAMIKVDKENQKELKKILKVIKLPSVENVGYEGSQAIWLVAQHAVNDLTFMKHVLDLMQEVAKKDLKNTYYKGIPYLVDRINMKEHKSQIYGTQFTKDRKGKLKVYKIESTENLDKQRTKFGLEPFKEYEKHIKLLNRPVKFPRFRQELLDLEAEDQREIRENFYAYTQIKTRKDRDQKYKTVTEHCHKRAHRMMHILDEIKDPTVENIGLDGSKAVSLLALHSYLDIMKKVLAIYEDIYQKEPDNIYYQAIPPLIDRIVILERRKQLFGTNWHTDKNGKPFLIPVENFAGVNKRRAVYGLEPARRPRNLAKGAVEYPLGKGLAKDTDQKPLTDAEYAEYSQYSLRYIGHNEVD